MSPEFYKQREIMFQTLETLPLSFLTDMDGWFTDYVKERRLKFADESLVKLQKELKMKKVKGGLKVIQGGRV